MSVHKKLNEAREKFHALKLEKTGHNKFAGYKYFELGDFLIPALKVFKDAGLCATVSFDAQTARMMIVDVDKPDSSIALTSPMGSASLKGCHEVQNIGAVETYQRRYLWTAALEIVEHDALDATTGNDKPAKVAGPVGVMGAVLDAMPPLSAQDKEYFQELAQSISETLKNLGQSKAFDRMELEQLDNDQKLYLNSFLDAKTRAALKAEKGLRIGAA